MMGVFFYILYIQSVLGDSEQQILDVLNTKIMIYPVNILYSIYITPTSQSPPLSLQIFKGATTQPAHTAYITFSDYTQECKH